MRKEWNIFINNNSHQVLYLNDSKQKKQKLLVDGRTIEIRKNKKFAFIGVDFPIIIDGVECRFVSAFNGIDFVVNGNFIETQKPYSPLNIPWWCWFFVGLSVLIPIISLGGAIPTAIACLSSIWCLKFSASPFINFAKKLRYNILLVVSAWILFGLLLFGLSG